MMYLYLFEKKGSSCNTTSIQFNTLSNIPDSFSAFLLFYRTLISQTEAIEEGCFHPCMALPWQPVEYGPEAFSAVFNKVKSTVIVSTISDNTYNMR